MPYLEPARWTEGPDIRLADAPGFCSHARFCVRGKGIWALVAESGNSEAKVPAIRMAADCSSGRLVIQDKNTGNAVEPLSEKSIGLVEGPISGNPGPLWVRGVSPSFRPMDLFMKS